MRDAVGGNAADGSCHPCPSPGAARGSLQPRRELHPPLSITIITIIIVITAPSSPLPRGRDALGCESHPAPAPECAHGISNGAGPAPGPRGMQLQPSGMGGELRGPVLREARSPAGISSLPGNGSQHTAVLPAPGWAEWPGDGTRGIALCSLCDQQFPGSAGGAGSRKSVGKV